jgi:acetyltransferase
MLEVYGIPTLPVGLAATPEQAIQIAEQIGYPVAMKVASQAITHKSDIGGVLLNLLDSRSVCEAFDVIVRNARLAHPEADIQGVHLQRMVPAGQEVILGSIQDAQFGALLMFGSGGVEVEGLKDVAFSLAPLSCLEANDMLASTWAGQKLAGYRNLPPADRTAVIDAMIRLGQLSADFPELSEIEINPLRVLDDGEGVFAIDVRARRSAN